MRADPPVSVHIGKNTGHTGVVLVSRYDWLSSVIRSPHFLQTALAYTLDLECLEV